MTASEAIARTNQEHGLGMVLGDRCPGGEVGAYYVTDRTGRRLVLKWSDDPNDAEYFAVVRARVRRLEDRGYPVPRYLPPVVVDGGVLFFQEAVGGAWRDDVGEGLVDTAVRLVDLQADAAGDEASDWSARISG